MLRLEIIKGWKVKTMRVIDAKEEKWHHIQNSRRRAKEEKSKELEKILIIDQEGSLRTVDLVEEVKDPKKENSR